MKLIPLPVMNQKQLTFQSFATLLSSFSSFLKAFSLLDIWEVY